MSTTYLHGPEHVERYRATDGEEGYRWRRDTEILLLTTVGRKSGSERTQALIFREIDGNYVIVASKGGNPQHPGWYLNLLDEPEVGVQVKGDRFRARARVAEGEERERLWREMTEVWPDYDRYQTRTDREIPVVVIESI
ncbi:MAG TPA: nitroreductase family deazaflavin-dependent oxidoreductase [Solirubrobacteraceae bacterium]|nr:nitroreductase family deazaflavin-dependent oxidoreductase [Solirubrobacteraceae bacterium]